MEDEMGKICRMHREMKNAYKMYSQNLQGRDD
jgi:hypothetical protein